MAAIYTMSFLIMIVTEIDNPEFRCGRMLYIWDLWILIEKDLKYKVFQTAYFQINNFQGQLKHVMTILTRETHVNRSSHRRCSLKTAVLKNFAIFTGKRLCWSFFNKVVGQKARNFIKKRLQHSCFLWILRKFLKHVFGRTSAKCCFCVNIMAISYQCTNTPQFFRCFLFFENICTSQDDSHVIRDCLVHFSVVLLMQKSFGPKIVIFTPLLSVFNSFMTEDPII